MSSTGGDQPYSCDPRVRSILKIVIRERHPIAPTGRPAADVDVILDAMEYMLWTGMPYRALERVQLQYNFRTVNAHIVRWARSGAFQEAYRRAMRLQRRPVRRGATHNALDTTYVKSMYGRDQVGRNPTDRGRRATKVSALVDEDGVVHSLAFFEGNAADCNTVDATLQNRVTPVPRGTALYADKGYDSERVRQAMRDAGYVDRISKRNRRRKAGDRAQRVPKHNTVVQRVANRRRGIVERVFSWLDKSRRLLVRHDALVVVYAAYTWLACMRILGRRLC